MMTVRVRQNPQTAAAKVGGQYCPHHGQYETPHGVLDAQRAALSPNVPVDRARSLLEYAARLRRACPECDGPATTMLGWAVGVRDRRQGRPEATHTQFRLPPIEVIDPEAASW